MATCMEKIRLNLPNIRILKINSSITGMMIPYRMTPVLTGTLNCVCVTSEKETDILVNPVRLNSIFQNSAVDIASIMTLRYTIGVFSRTGRLYPSFFNLPSASLWEEFLPIIMALSSLSLGFPNLLFSFFLHPRNSYPLGYIAILPNSLLWCQLRRPPVPPFQRIHAVPQRHRFHTVWQPPCQNADLPP